MTNTKGESFQTIVDTCMLGRIASFCGMWYPAKLGGPLYVAGSLPEGNSSKKTLLLHRFILNPPSSYLVDHINHDTMDNRLVNLRLVTRSENGQNRKGAQQNSKSGIRGVSWHKQNKKWVAQIKVNGKRMCLGFFSDIHEAERVVGEARRHFNFKDSTL
ncbi:HNH endonuclease [Paenibacillus sp. GYB004]|uniref:HNH endonuclease n=1 Tax=Paenibacillus sp. GYB004 TaxID=2994393 RepID=UPI003FA75170